MVRGPYVEFAKRLAEETKRGRELYRFRRGSAAAPGRILPRSCVIGVASVTYHAAPTPVRNWPFAKPEFGNFAFPYNTDPMVLWPCLDRIRPHRNGPHGAVEREWRVFPAAGI